MAKSVGSCKFVEDACLYVIEIESSLSKPITLDELFGLATFTTAKGWPSPDQCVELRNEMRLWLSSSNRNSNERARNPKMRQIYRIYRVGFYQFELEGESSAGADLVNDCLMCVYKYLVKKKGDDWGLMTLNSINRAVETFWAMVFRENEARTRFSLYLYQLDTMIRTNRHMPEDKRYWTQFSKRRYFFSCGLMEWKCLIDLSGREPIIVQTIDEAFGLNY